MTAALAFLAGGGVPAFGGLLSRLRWRRALGIPVSSEVAAAQPAADAFSRADAWVVVLEPESLPGAGRFGAPASGAAEGAARLSALPREGAAPHTLRELAEALPRLSAENGPPPAVAFRTRDFLSLPGESAGDLLERVRARAGPATTGFAAVALGDPSDSERTELSGRVPLSARFLLDVGCGRGATSAALRARRPGLSVTGIEKDADAAARARERLDRVIAGDAREVLESLAASGERFDAFLFGDVLEHTADPIAVLSAARAAARPGAALVASVPNVSHASLVRDLLVGRFDPVPAGLLDWGHLRWFTRSFLTEAIEEAGWSEVAIEGTAGAPAAGADDFVAFWSEWPGLDRQALGVYQWLAVARAA